MKRLLLVMVVVSMGIVMLSGGASAQDSGDERVCSGQVADDAPEVRIGAAVSQTGSLAREGNDTLNGYNLWLDWVNNEYGGIEIDGVCHRAVLIAYDDESDSDTVALLTERLIFEDEVDVMLGPYGSGLTQVASQITEREDIIMVEGNGASESLFERDFINIFGVLTPATLYTRSGIELAYEQGARTAVIAYEDAAFAASVAEGAQMWMDELGIEVLAVETYPVGPTDLTAMFTNFADLDPDLFVGGGHFNDAVIFIQTARELGFSPDAFLITVGPSNPTFVEEMGDDAEYVWGASQWESSMDWEDEWIGSAADYAERYEEMYDMAPSYQAAESTAAALVLHLAIEEADSLETADIRDALNDTDIVTFYGPIEFDETGKNIAKPMATIQIQDGEILVIAPEEAAVADVIWPAPAWDDR